MNLCLYFPYLLKQTAFSTKINRTDIEFLLEILERLNFPSFIGKGVENIRARFDR